MKALCVFLLIFSTFFVLSEQYSQNKTHHNRKQIQSVSFVNPKGASYRSYRPISMKFRKTVFPKRQDRLDYDLTAYDTEYGGLVSNFTSIYDETPIYPNPEVLSPQNSYDEPKKYSSHLPEGLPAPETIPDDSLADADLKEHNIIDSVTYLYGGLRSCHSKTRTQWIGLIIVSSGIAIALLTCTVVWLLWSKKAKQFREQSKLYPFVINLCCCLQACTLIYIQAIMGASSPSQCEKIALLLHYTYLTCSTWIVLITGGLSDYVNSNKMMSLKYNYLVAYGAPAVVVTFNYALSMEQYEIKHYCWMSIEKGMVMGFMVPVMILILVNTAVAIHALASINNKQTELIDLRINGVIELCGAKMRQDTVRMGDMTNVYSPGSSRKNTDTSDNYDYQYTDDECNCGNEIMVNEHGESSKHEILFKMRRTFMDQIGDVLQKAEHHQQNEKHNSVVIDHQLCYNDSIYYTASRENQQIKTYLYLCLVMEPFFAVNWVMGVLAVENASYWPTPNLYLIMLQAMYIYFIGTVCTTLPVIGDFTDQSCEDIVVETTVETVHTSDNIPLLDPSIHKANHTPAPVDTISTISI